MKFGCRFSLLILLFISLQSSSIFAVLCPTGSWTIGNGVIMTYNSNETKQCSTCVLYTCAKIKNQTAHFHKGGCPEDFYNDCTDYPDHAEFIKKNGSNSLEYQFDSGVMAYISGCSGYCNGTECISQKAINFNKDWTEKLLSVVNNVVSRIKEDPKGMGDVCDSVDPNVNKKTNGTTTPSASKGQDGTMKNIGIFLIGFIFAAWIY